MKFKRVEPIKERTLNKFAWFPVLIDNHYIWLERYKVKQKLVWGVHPDLPKYYYETIKRWQL